MFTRWQLALAAILACSTSTPAQSIKPTIDSGAIISALSGGNTDALAGSLRGALIRAIPTPLYEKYDNWGKTERVSVLRMDGLKPHIEHKDKKDGKWKHLRADALMPANSLILDIRDLKNAGPGLITFTVYLSCPVRAEYTIVTWERGLKVWDRSYKGRCKVLAELHCEATFRVEPVSVLPDLVFRLRVADAKLSYDDFVMEHVAGLGGEAAEFLGEMGLRNVKRFHPSLEKDLLAKGSAAIEKAADTKEVRVSLYDMLKKKGWLPAKE